MKTSHRFTYCNRAVLLAALAALPAVSALAQTSWTGGAAQNWSTATWSAGVPDSLDAITLTPTAAATLTIPNGTAAVGSSLDFSSTAFNAGLTIADGGNLTLSGAITTSGNKSTNISISNTTSGNAATVLTASSIAVSTGISLNAGGSAAGHFSFGNNITTGVQVSLGVSGTNGSNWTQTGGTTNVGSNGGYGLSIGQGATTAGQTGIATYNLNGGTLVGARIGVLNGDGNNGVVARYALNGVLNFNNGIIQNSGTGNLNVVNGIANSGSTPNTAQWDTSKPLSVVLGGGTAREFQANTGNIIFSPSAVLSGTGNFTKTGTGSLVFTGGNTSNSALNTWSGNSTVTNGAIAVNYSQIAGEAATGGTDTLSGAYSAASRLVLNGGNFTMTGRGSASGTTATAGTIVSGTQLTLPSTAGLVVGQSVSGTNVAPGTYIRQILSGTQIQLSHQTVGNAVINGNTLTFGAASFANTQTINDVTLSQSSTVTVNPGAGTSTTLLSFGNVTGAGRLTKAGTGTLQLTGSLDYTGATAVSAGTLEFANASGTNTLTGNVTGAGAMIKSGAGTLILASAASGGSNFSGSLAVNGGTLQIGNIATSNDQTGRLASVSSVTVGSGGTLTLAASSALNSGAAITLNGTINVNTLGMASNLGFNNVLGALTMNGGTLTTGNGANQNSFQSIALNGNVTVSGTSASNITAGGSQGNAIHLLNNSAGNRTFDVADVTSSPAADLTVSARLINASAGLQAAGIIKSGAGTMVLSGNNTYTGTTTVTTGTLLVNGNTSSSSAVNVSSGATLGGNGTIGGATTINGTHSPGNSPGLQTFGSDLTYNSATVAWELTGNSTTGRGSTFDGINVGGNLTFTGTTGLALTFNGGNSTVDWSNSLWNANITGTSGWLIYSGATALNGFGNLTVTTANWADAQGDLFNSVRGGSNFSTFQDGNNLYLNYAIPEPSTWALLAFSLTTALVLRRRRNS